MIVQESPHSSVIFLPIDGDAETFVTAEPVAANQATPCGSTSRQELVNMVRSAADPGALP